MEVNKNINAPIAEGGNEQQEGIGLNVVDIIFDYIKYWRWFLLSLLICLSIAVYLIKKENNVYQVRVSVLLNTNNSTNTGNNGAINNSLVQSLGLPMGSSVLENEILVMHSKNLLVRVVESLGIYTSYYVERGLRNEELYPTPAISLDIDSTSLNNLNSPLRVLVMPEVIGTAGNYNVKVNYGLHVKNARVKTFPVEISIGNIAFILSNNSNLPQITENLSIFVSKPRIVANGLYNAVSVVNPDKTGLSTILTLTNTTTSIAKGIDILNRLVEVYNNDAIDQKNRVGINTANFIDGRLSILTKELSGVEQEVEGYRKTHRITNLSSEATNYLSLSTSSESQLFNIETQLNLLNYVEIYLQNKENHFSPIPKMGITDTGVASLIDNYNQALVRRDRLMYSSSETNPAVINITTEIESMRGGIFRGLESARKGYNISIKDLKDKDKNINQRITQVPELERELAEIMRQQSIKERLFIFLLEKREENSLAMSMNVPIARMLDTPESTGAPIAPKKAQMILIALSLGLLIPALIIFLKNLFNIHFKDRTDIERMTRVPILGEISSSSDNEFFVIKPKSSAPIVELFRLLRNNLQFILDSPEKKVISVTSTVTKEGKTFISSNLALSFALTEKRVVLVGLDIRRPRLVQHFNLTINEGLTSYLSGQVTDLESLIVPSGIHDNLWLLPAGHTPPNPNELLMNARTEKMFEYLRANFDYVILDTAPVGMVSDSFLVQQYCDISLYIVRAGYSSRKYIEILNRYVEAHRFKSPYIVINDVDMRARSYSYRRYGYGYGYGYGKGYTYRSYAGYGYKDNEEEESKSKNFLKQLFQK